MGGVGGGFEEGGLRSWTEGGLLTGRGGSEERNAKHAFWANRDLFSQSVDFFSRFSLKFSSEFFRFRYV